MQNRLEEELDLGAEVVDFIIFISGAVVTESAPGWVSLLLFAIFISIVIDTVWRSYRRQRAISRVESALKQSPNTEEFSEAIGDIDREISAAKPKAREEQAIAFAWREYRETQIADDSDERPIWRNTVRPSVFFNIEDLQFGPGYWRIVPGMFVSTGLLLTFLGLIAALNEFQQAQTETGELSGEAMANFLRVAAAKFIMSLTGLSCSILFTLLLRWSISRIEDRLHHLNSAIEKRLSFLSQEDLALRQLRAIEEGRDRFREIGYELVAEFGRPLREELPQVIGETIREGMAPLVKDLKAQSSEGIGAMVEGLSQQLSGDVGRALSEASGRLDHAAERLSSLADRLETSVMRMGETLEATTAGLSNTTKGLEETLSEMTKGAAEKAGSAIEEAAQAAAKDIDEQAGYLVRKSGEALLAPLDELSQELARLSEATNRGASAMQTAAHGVKSGGEASQRAASSFGNASDQLLAATAPVRETVEKLEKSNTATLGAAREIAASARENANAANRAVKTAEEVLGGKAKAIEAALSQLSTVLDRLKGQGEQLDTIDAKLGKAFDTYTSEVQTSVDQLFGHVRKMQEELAPALETLREVVEQAEAFAPEQPRRR